MNLEQTLNRIAAGGPGSGRRPFSLEIRHGFGDYNEIHNELLKHGYKHESTNDEPSHPGFKLHSYSHPEGKIATVTHNTFHNGAAVLITHKDEVV